MLRMIRTLVLPALIGLGILALIGLAGSALFLYREAAAVHPILGIAVAALFGLGIVLLLIVPLVRVARLPGALVRPKETTGPKWERYVDRYAARLLGNRTLRAGDYDPGQLETALRSSSDPDRRRLAAETERAVAHLDRAARDAIIRHAAAVFTATAVSQSGRLDTAVVLSAQFRMIREVAEIYYQRPRPREMLSLYANVGAAGFIAGEIQDSEILAVLGAPVSASLTGLIPVGGADPLVTLLVNSLLDGSANALLTLRVGALARRSCGLRLEEDRALLNRSASLEAAGLLGVVVGQGATKLATMTRKLVLDRAVKGTSKAAREVAGAGSDLFGRINDLASQAGAAFAGSTARGLHFLQESLRFWERIAASAPPESADASNQEKP
ncbi:MAG: DUF697 domain-containing protein [Candidatus Eisenbacteria bacterium]|nr:DUF697 domain-containing protein [Candidatus Latescibacterota bacterium]MBD3300951.1 DUF697 domain-containing protein [Candidatus Eisenbacteria bacterium]